MNSGRQNNLVISALLTTVQRSFGWGVACGLIMVFMFILHVFVLARFMFMSPSYFGLVFLRISAICILLYSTVWFVFEVSFIAARSLINIKKTLSFRFRFIFLSFLVLFPMVSVWIVFGMMNGQSGEWVIIAFLGTMLMTVAVAWRIGYSIPEALRISRLTRMFLWTTSAVAMVVYVVVLLRDAPPKVDSAPVLSQQDLSLVSFDRANVKLPVVSEGDRARLVVLLTVDTLRADHMGYYGYCRRVSPAIDRLASEGVVWRRMVAAASGTVPSFATIFSGKYPVCHGVADQAGVLPDWVPTLAERLKEAGYKTYGLSTNGHLTEKQGFAQGFEVFLELGDLRAHEVADAVKPLLEEAATGGEHFFWIHLMDPHNEYRPESGQFEAFLSDRLYMSERIPVVQYGSYHGLNIGRTLKRPYEPWEADVGYQTALYDGEILTADDGVGTLLELIDENGLMEDTVLFFTADHGETLYRGSRDPVFNHALDLYESTIHVPAIAWAPGRLSGGVEVEGIVRHVDVFPTVLALAGLGSDDWPASSIAGETLVGQPGDLDPVDRTTTCFSQTAWWDGLSLSMLDKNHRFPAYAVVQDQWKYVHEAHTDLAFVRGPLSLLHVWRYVVTGLWRDHALYRTVLDPGERTDVSESYPDKVREMRGLLASYLASVDPEVCGESESVGFDDPEMHNLLKALGYLD